ncbi:MAG: molybdenum cofactor biosynthesis protein [Pelagibacteraceae bacterium]|nr:molybdenum cofactor biosynthesis protein [Pelagibacteraceae bacterium]|tara:strand:+ start:2857 stop:3378 length:522 start_codon:yes stop_codon:yes gene_type:complete
MINEELEFKKIGISLITISDSRNEKTDKSGNFLKKAIEKKGHTLTSYDIISDDKNLIQDTFNNLSSKLENDVIISSGGTGLTGRDNTIDAVKEISETEIPGFGELFRYLSFKKIGTSTIQSRSSAFLINKKYAFCLPGSNSAVQDAWNKILFFQLDIRHKPCNFVELIPRLNE